MEHIVVGILSDVQKVACKSGVLSVHFKVGSKHCCAKEERAQAILTWTAGSKVRINGWSVDGTVVHARHGEVLESSRVAKQEAVCQE